MAADGVSFSVALVNNVTRPAREAQRSMDSLQRSISSTKRSLEAPSPKRTALADWDKSLAKARMGQSKDWAKVQSAAAKLTARDQIKEIKRVADVRSALAQSNADHGLGATLGNASAGMAVAGTAAMVAAAAAVGYLAYQFGKASVEAAAFGERSRLALSLLIGNSKTAGVEFNAVRREAQQLGLDVFETQAGFQKLLAAQFEIGKAKELIRMSADLQAIGASADQTKRAIIAISQIKNTGYLQGDELNQLREAGVSTELVYEALGKRLGKTTQQIISMQEKRQLGSNDVIESILEAVRKKTGSATTGDAGKVFAASIITGMAGVFSARVQNAFVDIGDAILPGLQRLMAMASSFVDRIAGDPKLAALGEFLLGQFDKFVSWAETNWPAISDTLTTGVHVMAEAIQFAVEMFDTGTVKGQILAGILGTVAAVFAVVALSASVMMIPLYAAVVVFGAIMHVVGQLASFVYDQFAWLYNQVASLFGPDAAPGVAPVTGSGPMIASAADGMKATRLVAELSGVGGEPTTVAAEPQGPLAMGHTFDFSGMQVGDNVDKEALAAQIRSQISKALEEAA